MARARPATAGALADVFGVGPAKMEKYGEEFLDVVRRPSDTDAVTIVRPPMNRFAHGDSLYFRSSTSPSARWCARSRATKWRRSAKRLDDTQEFPWENVRKMGELGLLGIPWPEELGGAGLDIISFIIAIEELARVDASHSITISAHTTLGTSPIVNFGTHDAEASATCRCSRRDA